MLLMITEMSDTWWDGKSPVGNIIHLQPKGVPGRPIVKPPSATFASGALYRVT